MASPKAAVSRAWGSAASCGIPRSACSDTRRGSIGECGTRCRRCSVTRVAPLNREVTASLTTIAAPSFSMPAVVLGRDWATTTVGSQYAFDPAWSGLVSFTAQVGQQRATVYGGLLGLSYTFAQAPSL